MAHWHVKSFDMLAFQTNLTFLKMLATAVYIKLDWILRYIYLVTNI